MRAPVDLSEIGRLFASTLLVVCLAGCGGSARRAPTTSACSARQRERTAVARDLAVFVKDYGPPGALAVVCTPEGSAHVAAGFSDLQAKVKIRPTDRFRIGSVTKTFVATVVLQLVAEKKLRLGDTVERWLPGVVPRGREITIRELLNHTSGVPDYFEDADVAKSIEGHPRLVIPPRTLVAHAVSHPLKFKPGSEWGYSNTNYQLLGLIIEKATGNSVGAELSRRIFKPLDLEKTTFDARGDRLLDSEIHGYDITGSQPRDVTLTTLGGPWAAGGIVSNTDDVAHFFSALLGGKLLPSAQLRAMKTITPAAAFIGLGIFHNQTPCQRAWSHDGRVPGYLTLVFANDDGTRVVVAATNGDSNPAGRALGVVAGDAFCAP